MAWLRDEREHAPSSLARFLVVVRMYMRFLVEERLVKHDRVQLVQGPKQWLELPEVLSIEEVDRLLKAHRPDACIPAIAPPWSCCTPAEHAPAK